MKRTRSKKAGLKWSVSRTEKKLRENCFTRRLSSTAPVVMAAVMEYLVAEILDISCQVASSMKKKRITPRHLLLAAANDDEFRFVTVSQTPPHQYFRELLQDVILPSSGVLPKIIDVLLPSPSLSLVLDSLRIK